MSEKRSFSHEEYHMLLQTTCEQTALAPNLRFKFMLELMVVSLNSHMTLHNEHFRPNRQKKLPENVARMHSCCKIFSVEIFAMDE